jgi:hypothetical protein
VYRATDLDGHEKDYLSTGKQCGIYAELLHIIPKSLIQVLVGVKFRSILFPVAAIQPGMLSGLPLIRL